MITKKVRREIKKTIKASAPVEDFFVREYAFDGFAMSLDKEGEWVIDYGYGFTFCKGNLAAAYQKGKQCVEAMY